MIIQEKFATKEEAITRAKELAKTEKYVSVIASKDEYYVENEISMIRSWEQLVAKFENGKES